ncbi:polyprenyl synthetase family protein [Candidatus Daviesbacteria bacterium]|nr:polyprenyl synthetase family protein [Candidatus Daviesbacteria bacterium]
MDFKNYLKVNAKKINQELDSVLADFLAEVKSTSPKLLSKAKGFLDFCKGGKRIRGVLVNLGYEIGKGRKTDEIFKIGAGLEILHTAILVHDDIIDESPLRRGKPSLFKTIGLYSALTLGDLGFFLAFKIIAESNFPNKNEALRVLSKTMIDTTIGQMMDIQKQDPELTAQLKTAQYTIFGPLTLGATLARADKNLIRVFREFGEDLGIAYQIKDDILDQDLNSAEITRAQGYVNKAKKMIPDITKDPNMSKLLEQMGDYLIERRN